MTMYQALQDTTSNLTQAGYFPAALNKQGIAISQDGNKRSLYELMSYPNISMEQLKTIHPDLTKLDTKILERVGIESKYSKYLDRQAEDISLFKKYEGLAIPDSFSVQEVKSLSAEVKEKIESFKPKTIGELSKISGITPAAVVAILVYLTKKERCVA